MNIIDAPRAPAIPAEAIRQQVRLLQREPFRDQLAKILSCAPDEDSLKAFAAKHPDRWAQCVAIFARTAGYTEKVMAQENNLFMQINVMSDSDLLGLLDTLQKQLGNAPVIDVTPENPA